jgi:hypothetical protein
VILLPRSKVNPFESPVGTEELPPEPEQLTESKQSISVPVSEFAQLLAAFNARMNESQVMFAEKLAQAIEVARKPPVSEFHEKQQARAHEAKLQAQKAYWEGQILRAENCSHQREDQSSAIAWARQSDGVTRGICQHCPALFSPRREECLTEEIWQQYKEKLRIPTQRGNSVVYVD